jgi:hypothetical protein
MTASFAEILPRQCPSGLWHAGCFIPFISLVVQNVVGAGISRNRHHHHCTQEHPTLAQGHHAFLPVNFYFLPSAAEMAGWRGA